jgi:hypothetical protein
LPSIFLLIDEDGIDNDGPPNNFTSADINDQIAALGLRTQLPYFAANVSETIELYTGQVGDEGWFALTTIPESWHNTGPTDDGLQNFLGLNNIVGPGLGTGTDPEEFLDKIPDVIPLGYAGLEMLEDKIICAVVYDGDISINYEPITGSLMGATLGIVGFEVEELTESSSTLPKVTITILDANEVCGGPLALFTEAAELLDTPPSEDSPVFEGPVQNATGFEDVMQNATEFEDVSQNATQETGPIVENSTDTSDEAADNSAEESTPNDVQDEEDGTEDTGEEQQSESRGQEGSENTAGKEQPADDNDNSDDNQSSGQEGSENESGDEEEANDENSNQSNPSESSAQGQ